MGNFNIQVDLTKLPGARVMDIQGKKSTRQCVVIPSITMSAQKPMVI